MEALYVLILIAGAAAGGIYFLRPKHLFIIAIRGGSPSVARGKVAGPFLGECRSICEACRIEKGKIYGRAAAGGAELRFSPDIPEEHRQKFRNVWNLLR